MKREERDWTPPALRNALLYPPFKRAGYWHCLSLRLHRLWWAWLPVTSCPADLGHNRLTEHYFASKTDGSVHRLEDGWGPSYYVYPAELEL